MEVKIRKATLNDLDIVSQIENICFPKAEAATKKSLEYRIKTFTESFFLAILDEKIVGFINGAITDSDTIVDELYEVGGLHNSNAKKSIGFGLDVLPEYRKNGIGEKLMKHLMKEAKKSSKEKMILTCKEKLIQYYEKFGYKNMGVSNSTHGGVVWYDMVAVL